MRNNLKTMMAWLLTLCLLLSGAAALAEGATVEVQESGTSAVVTVKDDVQTTESYGINVLVNDENPGTSTSVSVEGNNSYENRDDDGNYTNVDSLTVNAGNVDAHPTEPYSDPDNGDETMAYGLHAFVNEEVQTPVSVTVNAQDVTATSDAWAEGSMRATGIDVENSNENASMTFNIEGDVTGVSDRESYGASIRAEGETTVSITGDVNANTTSASDGVQAVGVQANVGSGSLDMKVGGDINATNAGEYAAGALIEASTNGKATAVIEGNITANSATKGGGAEGLIVDSHSGKIDVQITGNISVEGSHYADGVSVYANESEVWDAATDAYKASGIPASASVTIDGDVSAKGTGDDSSADGVGVYGWNGGDASLTLNGGITAEGNLARGLYAGSSQDGKASATVNGDITASGSEATAVNMNSPNKGELEVTIVGDVSAAGEGAVGLNCRKSDDSTLKVLIDGTLSGDGIAIRVVETDNTSGTDSEGQTYSEKYQYDPTGAEIYAWKIEENKNGAIAEVMDYETVYKFNSEKEADELVSDNTTVNKAASTKLEKALWYIIKVSDAWKDALSATGTGTYAANGETYDVAHEDDDVVLKVKLPDGKKVASVMYDDGTAADYVENADGTYTVKMKRGGGMMLSLKLEGATEETTTDTTPSTTETAPTTNDSAPAATTPATQEAASVTEEEPEVVYEEVAPDVEVNGVKAEDKLKVEEALAVIGEALDAENVTVEIPGAEKVLNAEEMKTFNTLPVKDRLLVVLSALGFANDSLGEIGLEMSDEAKALADAVTERMEALSEDEKQALLETMAAAFPKGTVVVDGQEYESFSIELEIDRNGVKSYERYTFYNEDGTWKLYGIEQGAYEPAEA